MIQLALRTGAYKFQFTPLREGRPTDRWMVWLLQAISIHAPA